MPCYLAIHGLIFSWLAPSKPELLDLRTKNLDVFLTEAEKEKQSEFVWLANQGEFEVSGPLKVIFFAQFQLKSLSVYCQILNITPSSMIPHKTATNFCIASKSIA